MIPVIRVGPCRVRGEMVKETDHGTRPISQMNRDKRVGIMTMTKAGIVNSVYDRLDITKKEAGDYVEAVLDTIKDTLSEGEDIKVSGFGKFEIRAKGERVGRNPRTGVEIKIPERCVLRFKVSQVLKDRLNGKRED